MRWDPRFASISVDDTGLKHIVVSREGGESGVLISGKGVDWDVYSLGAASLAVSATTVVDGLLGIASIDQTESVNLRVGLANPWESHWGGEIKFPARNVARISLLSGKHGLMHMVWSAGTLMSSRAAMIFHSSSSDNGRTWKDPVHLELDVSGPWDWEARLNSCGVLHLLITAAAQDEAGAYIDAQYYTLSRAASGPSRPFQQLRINMAGLSHGANGDPWVFGIHQGENGESQEVASTKLTVSRCK